LPVGSEETCVTARPGWADPMMRRAGRHASKGRIDEQVGVKGGSGICK